MRFTAAASKPRKIIAEPAGIPAPVGGWDAISPLAAMPPDRAVQLDNWVCRPGWVETRTGYTAHAVAVGTTTTPVETIMAYNGVGLLSKLFAVAGGTIYDVTANGAASSTGVTGLANSRFNYLMFSNSSGTQYLFAVNGADTPRIFNGASWATTAITGPTQSNIASIAEHKGRLWMVETNSTKPWYMPIGAIAGPAQPFELGSFMTRGGYVQAIGTWTIDTRQTVDEYIAFVTSRGQVIVYQGTDPSTINTWSLVGVYNIGAPIGRRCLQRIAGNLIVICLDGIVPLTEMLSTDRAAANRITLSQNIMNALNQYAQLYNDHFGWQYIEYPKGTFSVLNVPTVENSTSVQCVMNTLTGAWSRFTNINANCWETDSNDNLYFGKNDGVVYLYDVGSSDYGAQITATLQTAYNNYGNAAQLKRWTMLQSIITSSTVVNPSYGLAIDFNSSATLTTPSVATPPSILWNSFNWNQGNWPSSPDLSPTWISVPGIGHWASVKMQVATGNSSSTGGVPGQWGVTQWGTSVWTGTSNYAVAVQVNGFNIAYEKGIAIV